MKKHLKLFVMAILVMVLLPLYVFADDTRTVISHVEVTSNMGIPTYGGEAKTYYTYSTSIGEPAYVTPHMGGWYKKNGDSWNSYNGSVFREGTYRYGNQLRIDDGGNEYKLDENPELLIDGHSWTLSGGMSIESSYSMGYFYSPEYEVEKNDSLELTFIYNSKLNIGANYVNHAIEQYSVLDAVIGGTEPYTFQKISGPGWVSVSADGKISGTPTAVGNNDNLVVRVTDATSAYKEITINVAKTKMNPEDRNTVLHVEATSNMGTPIYGGEVKTYYTYTTNVGLPAYVTPHMGAWYKKDGSNWVNYNKSTFEEGTYRYGNQLRIDEGSDTNKLDDNTELLIDGQNWTLSDSMTVEPDYSAGYYYSPEYVVEKHVVRTISVSYDERRVPFVKDATTSYFMDWIRNNAKSSTKELFVYDNLNTVLYTINGSNLSYKQESEDELLGSENEYAILYSLGFEEEGLVFPDNVTVLSYDSQVPIDELEGLTFILNGIERHDVYVSYSDYWNCIMIHVPMGHAKDKMDLYEPTVKLTSSNNTITASWDSQFSAIKYRVYRSLDNKKWTKLGDTTETSYLDKKLTYGQKYYYKVKAYDGSTWSKNSESVGKKVVPNKVENLKVVSASSNNVKLGYDKVAVTGYEIYSSTDNKKWSKAATITKNTTLEYNIKKLKANKTYYFKVRAYKTVSGKKVYGSFSSVLSTKTAPDKPGLKLSIYDLESIDYNITASKGASYYVVEEGLDGKTYDNSFNVTEANTYRMELLEFGKIYYFRVKACNSENRCSGWTTAKLKLTTKKPGLSLKTSSGKITATITSVEGADGYQLYMSMSKNEGYQKVKEFTTSEELMKYTMKTYSGFTYYFKVRSYKKVDGKPVYSPFSSIKSIKSK